MMDFSLTEEQRSIVEVTRSFVERELYPHEAEVERTGVLRHDLAEQIKAKAIKTGLYAANMPEDVGGAGLDTVTWVLFEKELGRANYALHSCIGRPSNILLAGTESQKERYLFPSVRGSDGGLPGDDRARRRLGPSRHAHQGRARRRRLPAPQPAGRAAAQVRPPGRAEPRRPQARARRQKAGAGGGAGAAAGAAGTTGFLLPAPHLPKLPKRQACGPSGPPASAPPTR